MAVMKIVLLAAGNWPMEKGARLLSAG